VFVIPGRRGRRGEEVEGSGGGKFYVDVAKGPSVHVIELFLRAVGQPALTISAVTSIPRLHRHPARQRNSHIEMATVKVIYRQKPVLPIFLNTAFLCWGNYEMYRIYKGTHPTFSTYLEKAGIYSVNTADSKDAAEKQSGDKRLERSGDSQAEEDGWTRMNGVPIPSLEMLIRPFRKG